MYGYTTRTRTPISGYLYLGVSLILHDSFTKTWEAEVQNEKVWHGKRRCPHNGKTVKMALSTWGRPLQTNFFRCAHGWTRKWTFGTSSSCLPSWCLGLFFPVMKYFGVKTIFFVIVCANYFFPITSFYNHYYYRSFCLRLWLLLVTLYIMVSGGVKVIEVIEQSLNQASSFTRSVKHFLINKFAAHRIQGGGTRWLRSTSIQEI